MVWYLDFAVLAAVVVWAAADFRTSTALTLFALLYSFGWAVAITSPEPDPGNPFSEGPFTTCTNTTFSCTSAPALCLPAGLACDGVPQCRDASDEAGCADRCEGIHWFRCHNGHCISSDWRCDGENDCMDWSDEGFFLCQNLTSPAAATTSSPISAPAPCRVDQFHCSKDDKCLPLRWRCDGSPDCREGEDETAEECGGERSACTQGQYTCGSGECIPDRWRCDGKPDCSDGSDEVAATWPPTSTAACLSGAACEPARGEFKCSNLRPWCLAATKVCDGQDDCGDNSDEGAFCQKTGCEALKCSQACLASPLGPACYCRPGFALAADNSTCTDVDECRVWGTCSQGCTNTPGSYSCSCAAGYTLANSSCTATSTATTLYFATKTEVRGLDLSTGRYFPVASGLPHVIGVGFDAVEARVYWTDVRAGQESILSSRVGGEVAALVDSGVDMPEDLVVDEVSRNLYFTDSIAKAVAVCSLDSARGCAVLVTDVQQPRALALHHARRRVLFTDWGAGSKAVGVVGMDGTGRASLVTEHLGWPNGLAVDEPADRVYWSDARRDVLESCDMEGGDRRLVLDTVIKHPFSLAVFEDRLFWSDWENKDIVSCNKFTGKEMVVHVKEVGVQPFGITVTNPIMTQNYTSPCVPNPCSHLCLPSTSSPRCLCPAHLSLLPDGRTCVPPTLATSLLVAAGAAVHEARPKLIGLAELPRLALAEGTVAAIASGGLADVTMVLVRQGATSTISRLERADGKLVPVVSGALLSTLAYDPRSRTVFWADLKRMAVMGMALATRARVEVAADLATPLALLVVPQHNRLVLGEAGRLSSLPLGPTTSTPATLLSTLLQRPTALAYSSTLDSLFVADSGTGNIYRQAWGSVTLVPVMANIGEVTALATEDHTLYWVEKGKPTLFWVSLGEVKELSWVSLATIAAPTDLLHLAIAGNTSAVGMNTACLSSTCSDFCTPLEGMKGATCSCSFGTVAGDGRTCSHTCPSSTFDCGDGRECLPASWRCDGAVDCATAADEANCTEPAAPACQGSQRACGDGLCIPDGWWCDGDTDCSDGRDEGTDCPVVECGADRWRCQDAKQCVVQGWRCDGDIDCRDGSDEAGCAPTTCAAEQFACSDGRTCLEQAWRCDGHSDCRDGGDEEGCEDEENEVEGAEGFSCGDGDVVDMELVCDGEEDCRGGEDEAEQLCHRRSKGREEVDPVVQCAGEEVQCGLECLPSAARCNGTWECPDYSDEADCSLCTPDTFRCSSGEGCIPRAWTCDGVEDCEEGSDERGCGSRTPLPDTPSCPTGTFTCLSGECVSLNSTCDSIPDCSDGSDESPSCAPSCALLPPPAPSCSPDHHCYTTPSGAVCLCRPGLAPAPQGACRDVDECQELSSCAHTCTNTKGGFKCSCEAGWLKEGQECRPRGAKPKLLYAVGVHIKGVEDHGVAGRHSAHQQLTTHTKPVASFVFNSVTGDFFWSSPGLGVIGRMNVRRAVSGSGAWLEGADRPAELALDWRGGNLYYSSQRSAVVTVCATATPTALCLPLATLPEDAVSKVAVDPRAALLFVAAYSRTPHTFPSAAIFPLPMDGLPAGRVRRAALPEIGREKTGLVTGLALDTVRQVVFWTDLASRAVRHCSYAGTRCGVAATAPQPRPAGLALFASRLYWTAGTSGHLTSHHLITNVTEERVMPLPHGAHSLLFSQPALQPLGGFPSPCPALRCSHLCLLTSPTTARCACPAGLVGSSEGSCVPPEPSKPSPTIEPNLAIKGRSKTAGGPHLKPVSAESDAGNIAAVIIVLIAMVVFVLCCVFVKCKNTKSGAEVHLRFTNQSLSLPGGAADTSVELSTTPQGGFVNPGFGTPPPRPAAPYVAGQWLTPPAIQADTPGVLEGRNTPKAWLRSNSGCSADFREAVCAIARGEARAAVEGEAKGTRDTRDFTGYTKDAKDTAVSHLAKDQAREYDSDFVEPDTPMASPSESPMEEGEHLSAAATSDTRQLLRD